MPQAAGTGNESAAVSFCGHTVPCSQFTFEVNLQTSQKIEAEPATGIGDIFG